LLSKRESLLAPVSGKVIPLAEVPDHIFAKKIAGDGVGIDSTGEIVAAPADGVIVFIFNTNHAFAMVLENEIELLVHIGIDTIELNGTGFKRLIEEGTNVKAGEPIIKVDREFITQKGYSLITLVLITNPNRLKEINYNTDIIAELGKDQVIYYEVD
ncbi:PTS glucose transporter subunit IIA, partial [Clostridiaceae bacterium UIB06]|nr:PTS glucose transporter subunit IIA [Clostridiaceae bacterium UIB06]